MDATDAETPTSTSTPKTTSKHSSAKTDAAEPFGMRLVTALGGRRVTNGSRQIAELGCWQSVALRWDLAVPVGLWIAFTTGTVRGF